MINIKFKYLYLKNFRIHDEFELDLSENKLLLIIGKNGSGKTTIMDAISWAIYDEIINGEKGDDVVNNIAKKDCCVILKFDVNNTEYEIQNYRKHSTHKNTKILLVNGIQVSTDMDVKQTNEILRNVLLEKDIFLNCLLFSQFIKKSFLKETHSGQKDILDQLLSFDKYDEYYTNICDNINNITIDINNINAKIELLNNSSNIYKNLLAKDTESFTNLFEKHDIELLSYKNSKTDLLEQKVLIEKTCNQDTHKKLLNVKENKIALIAEQTSILNNLSSSKEEHKTNIQNDFNMRFKLEESNIKNKYNESLVNLNKDLTDLNSEISEFESKVEAKRIALDTKLNTLNSKKDSEINTLTIEYEKNRYSTNELYGNKLNDLLTKKQTTQSKYIRLDSEVNNYKSELIKLNSQLEIYSNSLKDTGVCPECQQELISGKQHIIDKCDEISSSIEFYKNSYEKNNPIVIELKTQFESFPPLETEVRIECANKLNELDLDYKVKLTEINIKYKNTEEELTKKLPTFNEAVDTKTIEFNHKKYKLTSSISFTESNILTEINKVKEQLVSECNIEIENMYKTTNDNIKFVEARLTEYNAELQKINNEVSFIEYNINKLNDMNNKITNIEENIKYLEKLDLESKSKFEDTLKNYTNKLNTIELEIDSHNSEIDTINDNLEILKCWKRAFSDVGIKSVLLDESIPILNKRAKELCEIIEVLRVTFSSQTTLKSGKSNNKFSIDVIHNTHLSDYANLSAGETKLANIIILLCLRYLLEQMAGKRINILLLDEILDSLDETNSEIVVKILSELSREYAVLLITHTQKDWIPATEELRL